MDNDIIICYNALNKLLQRNFQYRRTKYINDMVNVQTSNLNYLIWVSVNNNSLILGFHENLNYKFKEHPKVNKINIDDIEIIDLQSKVKESEVTFITLDFKANYFLFADVLINGIAYYKTNTARSVENYIVKRRFIFKEEFTTKD